MTTQLVNAFHVELARDDEHDPALRVAPRIRWGLFQALYVRLLKGAIDRVLAAGLLMVVSPLMVVAAIAVRLSLGPGVLFRQERIGQHGRTFTCYKFRTLRHCRRQQRLPITHPDRRITHKHPNDPRLTMTGRWLRKWSIDELPQLFNVLAGDMSLLGPRPELPTIVDGYSDPAFHLRHAVKPGITGLWQVSERGHRPMEDCVDIDLEYVERVSLRLDLKILAQTPAAAFGTHRGH